MKKILSLILLLLSVTGRADVYSVRVDASSSNIPTAFSTSAASLVLQGVRLMRGVVAWSTASTAIVLNCSSSATVVPSNTSSNNIYIPVSGSISIDNSYLSGNCYLHSDSASAITSGVLYLMAIGG